MKQTAVEWLYDQIENKGKSIYEILEQAKARFEEQIKDAWFDGVTNWDSEKDVEDYINETFKSE